GRNQLDREAAFHFRDQIREARAMALRDGEAFEQVVFVLERIGVYLTGRLAGLAAYEKHLSKEACISPLAEEIPAALSDWHAPFRTLYNLVRLARNDALHQGAYARHLTTQAVELSIVLEDALMSDAFCARDFMVRDPLCAFPWQPISSIRRNMLVNSFSFLPVVDYTKSGARWQLLSDFSIASYLHSAVSSSDKMKRLARKLSEVVEARSITLVPAPTCSPEDLVGIVLERSGGLPVLVVGKENDLRGIVTPFDVL